MKYFGVRIAMVGTVCVLLATTSARATTITFDAVPSSGNPIVTSVTTDGFTFSSAHFHTVDSPGSFGGVDNGSRVYIAEEDGSLGLDITMALSGGGSFILSGFDGAELFLPGFGSGFPNANFINVLGNLTGGGTISASFALDGLRDGAGGIADFQTFVMPSSFSALLDSVVFSGTLAGGGGGGLALDNIIVNASTVSVPEASSTFGLLLLGLGSVLMVKLSRSKRDGSIPIVP